MVLALWAVRPFFLHATHTRTSDPYNAAPGMIALLSANPVSRPSPTSKNTNTDRNVTRIVPRTQEQCVHTHKHTNTDTQTHRHTDTCITAY